MIKSLCWVILIFMLTNRLDSKAIEFMNLLSSMDTKWLCVDISSVVDVALSDRHCVFFTTLLPIAQSNTERIVKKHYLSQKLLQILLSV